MEGSIKAEADSTILAAELASIMEVVVVEVEVMQAGAVMAETVMVDLEHGFRLKYSTPCHVRISKHGLSSGLSRGGVLPTMYQVAANPHLVVGMRIVVVGHSSSLGLTQH